MTKFLLGLVVICFAWEWFHPSQNNNIACATVAWIGLGVAVVSSGVGIAQTSKANKANKQNQQAYFDSVIKSEKEARKLFDQFIKGYNESAEKLEEGMTIQEYVERMVYALNDPKLEASYRKARNGDWEQAQEFADAANEQNISAFDMLVDRVSGGDYDAMLEARNKAIFSEDAESLYKEAQRIRSPKIPAGSVIKDEESDAVPNQRADKFDFEISETAIRQQNDRTFEKSRIALEDDRSAAQRQQQRASEFLPMLNYSDFVSQNVVQPFNQQSLQAQLAKLQVEAGLASNAMGAAYKSPVAPIMASTTASEAATAQGVQNAVAALAQIYKTQQPTQQSSMSRADSNAFRNLQTSTATATVY